jgi:hypothetical protein
MTGVFTQLPVLTFRAYMVYTVKEMPVGWISKIERLDKYQCFYNNGKMQKTAEFQVQTDAWKWMEDTAAAAALSPAIATPAPATAALAATA